MAIADSLLGYTTLDAETFAQIQIDVAQAMWSRGSSITCRCASVPP